MYKLNKTRKLARLVMAVYGYIISLANFRLLVYKVADLSNAIQRAHKVAKKTSTTSIQRSFYLLNAELAVIIFSS